MRVIGANDDEVGVVLSREEAAVLVAALSAHDLTSLDRAMFASFDQTLVNPFRYAVPMHDWLKKWVRRKKL